MPFVAAPDSAADEACGRAEGGEVGEGEGGGVGQVEGFGLGLVLCWCGSCGSRGGVLGSWRGCGCRVGDRGRRNSRARCGCRLRVRIGRAGGGTAFAVGDGVRDAHFYNLFYVSVMKEIDVR